MLGQEQRVSNDRQQRTKCLGKPLWPKHMKRRTRWKMLNNMLRNLGLFCKSFHPLLQVGLDYSLFSDNKIWRINSDETGYEGRRTNPSLSSPVIHMCLRWWWPTFRLPKTVWKLNHWDVQNSLFKSRPKYNYSLNKFSFFVKPLNYLVKLCERK